jgi:hypothetical protein
MKTKTFEVTTAVEVTGAQWQTLRTLASDCQPWCIASQMRTALISKGLARLSTKRCKEHGRQRMIEITEAGLEVASKPWKRER